MAWAPTDAVGCIYAGLRMKALRVGLARLLAISSFVSGAYLSIVSISIFAAWITLDSQFHQYIQLVTNYVGLNGASFVRVGTLPCTPRLIVLIGGAFLGVLGFVMLVVRLFLGGDDDRTTRGWMVLIATVGIWLCLVFYHQPLQQFGFAWRIRADQQKLTNLIERLSEDLQSGNQPRSWDGRSTLWRVTCRSDLHWFVEPNRKHDPQKVNQVERIYCLQNGGYQLYFYNESPRRMVEWHPAGDVPEDVRISAIHRVSWWFGPLIRYDDLGNGWFISHYAELR